ncbi:MAG: peptidylprolyl isomerase [Oscillospiraceae bacterium]|nr:peptidylprolyl isomerase [Oscillospiraceae bacterium]
MKCRYCQAELEEGSTVCYRCGMDNADVPEMMADERVEPADEEITGNPEPEKKSGAGKVVKIILAGVAALVLLAALVGVVYYGVTGSFLPRANDLYCKDSYAMDTETAAKLQKFQKKMDTVVATMGDATLTNSQLQVYYWMEAMNCLNSANSYGTAAPDFTKPLSGQIYDEANGQTWEQYFLSAALETWRQYQTMTLEAEKAGFVMPEEYSKDFDTLEADLESAAGKNGFESLNGLLTAKFGPGAALQDYRDYMWQYYTASLYLSEIADNIAVTEAEAEEYFNAHAQELYYYYGVTVAGGKSVDIRHILIMPEGGTKNASTGYTEYTDEEWEACRVKVQAIYDEWLSGELTEETFAEFAVKYSEDGNAKDGGIYTEVYEGQMVTAFNDWCFDESRQTGDHGLVKTQYGYHIMYFVDSREGINSMVQYLVQSQNAYALMETLVEQNPITVNYKSIVLGNADLG